MDILANTSSRTFDICLDGPRRPDMARTHADDEAAPAAMRAPRGDL
jgi:hypothetical protein